MRGKVQIQPQLNIVPIEEAVHQLRLVELDSELVLAAKAVGICLGD